MTRQFLTAAAAVLLAGISAPVSAQAISQEDLQTRYDRALAAGYKALFLCSAIANAERNGAVRTPESVAAWELQGIQAPLDTIVADLPAQIDRFGPDEVGMAGKLMRVAVRWDEAMPPRYAAHRYPGGCALQPIGTASTDSPHSEMRRPLPGGDIDWKAGRAEQATAELPFGPRYGEGTRTTALVVLQDGKLVSEAYAEPFGPEVPQRTWSVAKSIAATLVGAARERGEIDPAAPAGLAQWQGAGDPRASITIDDLLRMSSGRYSDTAGNRTDPLYFGGSTVEETALHWPLASAPGTVYRYANNDTLAAVKALEPSFAAHPPADLFRTLGMADTVAETDWEGDYILSSQVWSTARDLAKLGQLYLQDGVWNGERILPEGWVDYVSSPAGPQPDGPFGYGAGFWLLNASEGVPRDSFAAMGNRGQFIVIVPSRNVVIVRRGEDPTGSRFDIAGLTRDVLAQIEP